VATDRRLIGDGGALPLYRGSRLLGMFDIEGSDVVVAALDVHCKFLS